ncbi:MAG: hypothetical protein PHI97_04265 [Desulfobulbus sp.]|nr:hypothetical protein [Desulfobulbus sp.]
MKLPLRRGSRKDNSVEIFTDNFFGNLKYAGRIRIQIGLDTVNQLKHNLVRIQGYIFLGIVNDL